MVVLGLMVVAARAESAWVRIESEHFVLYSHAGQERVVDVALELEGYRSAIGASFPGLLEGPRRPTLPVVAFTGPDELSQFVTPPKRTEQGPAGLFRTAGARPLVAVNLDAWEPSSEVLQADFLDSLIASRTRAPLWAREGLSELFATARVEGGQVTIGQPSRETLDLLTNEHWLRIDDILTAQGPPPERHEALFAAEAWLLVHWCVMDPDGKRIQVIRDLMDPAARGVDPTSVLNPTSMPRAWLTEQLRTWFTTGARPAASGTDSFPRLQVPIQPVDTSGIRIDPVPEVEVEYRLGEVLTANRRLEEAEVMFQHALQLDPQSWMPYDGLAQLATANFRWGEARRLFAEATTRGPTTAGPYLDRGRTALTGVHGRAASEAAREAYEQATSLDPSALSAYVALSELAYRAKDYGESARWAGRGLQVDARDSMLRALLGRAQFATGDLTHARVNTQLALQECRDPRTCSEATALLRTVIERMPTTP